MANSLENNIKELVEKVLMNTLGSIPENFDNKTSLVSSGLIDSMSFVEMIQTLSSDFSCDFNIDDLVEENFENLDTIINLVKKSSQAA